MNGSLFVILSRAHNMYTWLSYTADIKYYPNDPDVSGASNHL